VQLLIPIVDPELLAVAAHRSEFEALGVHVAVSAPDVVARCNDKLATWEWFQAHDVRSPRTWLLDDTIDEASFQYPVFAKPRLGVGSVNATRVDRPEELALLRARVDGLIVQELLAGDEYTVDVIADFSGRVFGVVPRRRVETKAGISYKGHTCHDERLIGEARQICEDMGIRGPANLQCMIDADQISYFEINPRCSGTLPLTIAAGVNVPHWLVKLSAGHAAPDALLPFRDVYMARYWSEVFYDL
jgi:carbamoyl-phosphate synthase large subunit